MRRLVPQLVLLLLLVSGAVRLRAGEIIDRIVATVNGVAILQSDVDLATRYEAMLDGRALNLVGDTDRQRTLDRLIDQALLRQQMGMHYPEATASEIADRIRQIRAQVAGSETDDGWRAVLTRYGLEEQEFAERVALQMQLSRFIEQRLRPNIHVNAASVQAYYLDELLPELRKSGIQGEPPLAQVQGRIEEVLIQRRMDEELSTWVGSLREQGRVRTSPENSPAGAQRPRNAQTETGSAK